MINIDTDIDTRQSIAHLAAGTANQQDRDRVLYYLAVTRWDPERLRQTIERRHRELCAECKNQTKQRIDWGGILKTALWVIGALVAALLALLKVQPPF